MRLLAAVAVAALAACAGPHRPVPAEAPTAPPAARSLGAEPEGEVVPLEAGAPTSDRKVANGAPYVDFTAPKLGGGTLRLSDLVRQTVVLLQFWGVRCSPCLAEMEFLSSLQERHGSRGLQVLGVNTDSLPEESLARAMASRGIKPGYPVLCDPDMSVSRRYTQWLIPVTVLIDRTGTVQSIHTGYNAQLGSALEAEVEALLKGP